MDATDYTGPDTTDEEDNTDEMDTGNGAPAVATAPAPAAPGQPLVMQGGQGAVQVPPPATGYENAQQLANRAMWQQLRYKFAQSPLLETEAAVSAALKYQALRAFQNDVAKGVNPAEALSKVAPSLYTGKENTLGHAASFIKATQDEPKFRDIGGVLYQVNPNGSVIQLTPRKAPGIANLGPTITRIGKLEGELTDTRTPEDIKAGVPDPGFGLLADQKRVQLNLLRGQLRSVQGGAVTPTPLGVPNAPAALPPSVALRGFPLTPQGVPVRPRVVAPPVGAAGGRVRVRHPNGKIGTISAAALPKALSQGYSRVQ